MYWVGIEATNSMSYGEVGMAIGYQYIFNCKDFQKIVTIDANVVVVVVVVVKFLKSFTPKVFKNFAVIHNIRCTTLNIRSKKMVSKFEAGLANIMRNLDNAINAIRSGGDNNNGKIDTKGEKNQISQLLAGAKQEVGDFFNNNKPDANMSQEEYNKIKLLSNTVIEQIEATVNTEYDMANMKKSENANETSTVGKRTHVYKDGSYNVEQKEFDDGSYIATHFDKDGNKVGLKLYKNNKEIYANPDFAAEKIGLSKREEYNLADKIFRYMPFVNKGYRNFLDFVKVGQYHDGFYVYNWDEKNHEFKLERQIVY